MLMDSAHTQGKFPFEYKIVEVISDSHVIAEVYLTDKCYNHFGILHGGIHALIIDEVGMSPLGSSSLTKSNFLTSKLTVDYVKTSRDTVLLADVILTNLTDVSGKVSVTLMGKNGTVKSIGTIEFAVRKKFKKVDT